MNFIIALLVFCTSPVGIFLFLVKAWETDFETAIAHFENFVADILKD